MNTTPTTTIIEKAFSTYADITSRVVYATDKHQLLGMYHEAATILIDTHKHLPATHEELTAAYEELTREITNRIGAIEQAEVTAERYMDWKNATTEHILSEDIDTSFLNDMNEMADAVGIPMREAITALEEKPGLMGAAGDDVNAAAEFFDSGHWDLVRDIRAALKEHALA